MHAALETVLNGLMLGALYGLFGLGLSLSLGVMRMINLAHGDLIVLGAFLASVVMQATAWPPFTTLVVVLPAMFGIGWLLQTALLNRVVGKGEHSPLLLTFGLSIVLQNLLQQVFTADTRSLPAGDIAVQGIALGGMSLGVLPLLMAGASVVIFALTHQVIARSHLGRQARAVADDPATARLVGVDDRKLFALMTGLMLAVVSLAAVLYGMRTPFSPFSGPELLLYSFEAVVLGGLGRIWGTFLGGLVIGVTQVAGTQLHPGLGPFLVHCVFLLVLLVRPQGLLGVATLR